MPNFKRRKSMKAKTPKRIKRKGLVRNTYKPSTYLQTGTNPQNHVVFRGMGFPDKLTTNVVFAESIILDPSAGNPTPYTAYRLTSGYDPQNALGGGQPTYWDQLATIYSRYIVNGAKITVQFSRSTTATANVGPYICGIQCSDDATLPTTDPATLMSSPNSVARFVSDQDGTVMVTQTYSRFTTFPNFDDNLQSRMNNNPTINWFAKVFASPQGTDVEVPINVLVLIEYNVTLSDVLAVVDA